jgi:hypothetical protein
MSYYNSETEEEAIIEVRMVVATWRASKIHLMKEGSSSQPVGGVAGPLTDD